MNNIMMSNIQDQQKTEFIPAETPMDVSVATSASSVSNSTSGSIMRHSKTMDFRKDHLSTIQVGAANQQTALWMISFDNLLMDPAGVYALLKFLEKEYSAENIHFWLSCQNLRELNDPLEIQKEVEGIYGRFLGPHASEPINIDNYGRGKCESDLMVANAASFLEAEKQIYELMKHDSYGRFLKSDTFSECIRLEMSGKELPKYRKGKKKKDQRRKSWYKSLKPRLSISNSKTRPKSLNFDDHTLSPNSSKSSSSLVLNKYVRTPSPLRFSTPPESVEKTPEKIPESQSSKCHKNQQPELKPDLLKFDATPVTIKKFDENYDWMIQHKPPSASRNRILSHKMMTRTPDVSFSSDDVESEDFLSQIIRKSQKVPILEADSRSLFRYVSQPCLSSPSLLLMDNYDESDNHGVQQVLFESPLRLNPSLNDISSSSSNYRNPISKIYRQRYGQPMMHHNHQMLPPPPIPPKIYKYPHPPPPPIKRTPLKKLNTSKLDISASSLYV